MKIPGVGQLLEDLDREYLLIFEYYSTCYVFNILSMLHMINLNFRSYRFSDGTDTLTSDRCYSLVFTFPQRYLTRIAHSSHLAKFLPCTDRFLFTLT